MNRVLRFLTLALAIPVIPRAHAQFTLLSTKTIPYEAEHKSFTFVDNATRVIDVGTEKTSHIYPVDDFSAYLLIEGQPELGSRQIFERHKTHEIFYQADQTIGQDYEIHRYIKGYNLDQLSVIGTYTNRVYQGRSFSQNPASISMNADETYLYFASPSDAQVSVLNLDSHRLEKALPLNLAVGQSIDTVYSLTYQGQAALAIELRDTKQSPCIEIYSLANQQLLLHVSEADLGLHSMQYVEVRGAEFSADGSQAIVCGMDLCVVYNFVSHSVTAKLAMDSSIYSAAQFSPDGQYLLITDISTAVNGTGPDFSMVRASNGKVILPGIVYGQTITTHTFLTQDKTKMVVSHGNRLLLISLSDGKVLQENVSAMAKSAYDDLAPVSEAGGHLQFMTSDTNGNIAKWELTL